jgi:hypothetical protein
MPCAGMLELKDDEFIKDVISRLSDIKTEFISLREIGTPTGLKFDVIVDRISYDQPFLREIIKRLSLEGTYVINNPFSSEVTNKIVDTSVCSSLGIPIPKTMVLPYTDEEWDLGDTVKEPDLEMVGKEIGFPCVLKPYNGFAWENVYFVNNMSELINMYNSMKSRHVLLVQEKIDHSDYYRVFCVGKKDVLFIKYNPKPRCMGEYIQSDLKAIEGLVERLSKWTTKLNSVLDLDFNALEWTIDLDGKPFLIDAFNEIPEVPKYAIPPDYYEWIVDRFSAMVREKAQSGERNRTAFSL